MDCSYNTALSWISTDGLISMCNDLYEWRYISGKLPENGLFQKFAEHYGVSPYNMEEALLSEALKRFGRVASVLIQERPDAFFKKMKQIGSWCTMTLLEKLQSEKPDLKLDDFGLPVNVGCPYHVGLTKEVCCPTKYCYGITCGICWNREYEGES